jgi:hypothetical protein
VRPFWLGSKLVRWIWLHLKLSVARCWLGGFFWNPVGFAWTANVVLGIKSLSHLRLSLSPT